MGICKGRTDIKAFGEKMKLSKIYVTLMLVGVFGVACSSSPETAKNASGQNSNSAGPAATGQNSDPNAGAVNAAPSVNMRGGEKFWKKKINNHPPPPPSPREVYP